MTDFVTAYTNTTPSVPYPAFINFTVEPDGTVVVLVRSEGKNGEAMASIRLGIDTAIDIFDDVLGKLFDISAGEEV